MGREIMRVPLDFAWPLNKIWEGYENPHYEGHCHTCVACAGSGYNPATKEIADGWYGDYINYKGWRTEITQDEVDALLASGRLRDFTRNGNAHPTADEVNAWERRAMLGHDGINRWICIEARAKRLGVWGECEVCGGEGDIWDSPENEALYEAWEAIEPPTGDGWQVWETVSEGSPISPVFATPNELVAFLMGEGYSELAARNFVKSGSVMSMVMDMGTGTVYNDIESAALQG